MMCTETDTKNINPEFALYGPMGFDIGMLIGRFWMAYFAQPGHGNNAENQAWILDAIAEVWHSFVAEFHHLWRTERSGVLYEDSIYQDQPLATDQARFQRVAMIWEDALGFAGSEIIRRTLSFAQIAQNDSIEDVALRAVCEAKGLDMSRQFVVHRTPMGDISQVNDLAQQINKGASL